MKIDAANTITGNRHFCLKNCLSNPCSPQPDAVCMPFRQYKKPLIECLVEFLTHGMIIVNDPSWQCPVSYRGTVSNGREEALQYIIKIIEQRYSYAIIFEQPGCINNGKQRKILLNADHKETSIDILSHNWTRASLPPFLVSNNPVELMNTTAPRIKSGEIVPSMLSFEETLLLMIESSILKATSIEAEG
jgi:hypothetical protein